MPDLSIVLPVYNEIENLDLLCEKLDGSLSKLGKSYEIVMVDDGSTDGTWERLVQLSAQYKHLCLIKFRRNFGQTAAMSAGFREARGEIIITMDADLQNDPDDIPKLLALMDRGADVVSGWRKDRKDKFLTRRVPSMLANALISKLTGVHLHDYGCTLKAYRRELIQSVQLYGEMHRFIPALASWVGAKIDEVVVNHHPRRFGKSKYGLSRTTRVILDLMTVKFLLRYSTRPIQIFGKLGLLFAVPGSLMLVLVILGHLSFLAFDTQLGADLIKRPFWLITPFMLVLFGMQFISVGLLSELQTRTYHESQGKPIYVIKEILRPAGADGADAASPAR